MKILGLGQYILKNPLTLDGAINNEIWETNQSLISSNTALFNNNPELFRKIYDNLTYVTRCLLEANKGITFE